MTENFGIALLLTAGAGLSTTLGSLLAILVKKPGPRFLGFTLGFSAGVMTFVSFVELLPHSIDALGEFAGSDSLGFITAHLVFFAGMIVYFLIDLVIPHDYAGQHDHPARADGVGLRRTGLLVALGIGIHNFPEGMATFAGALKDVDLGLAIAVAIAIHNIPEGLAVSAPIYAATGSRSKAFVWSFLSGVSEPLGALVAGTLLLPVLGEPAVMGCVFALVAGIMVAISLDELIPSAKASGSEHTPIVGVIVGMAVMALSLWMLR